MKNTVKARVENALRLAKEREKKEWESYQYIKNSNEPTDIVAIFRKDWDKTSDIVDLLTAILDGDTKGIETFCK